MKNFLEKKGAALITVVALIVVTSAMVAAVYYFIRRGIEVTGLQKKYQTAREASLGGFGCLYQRGSPNGNQWHYLGKCCGKF